jgi:tetratricopeptide (TPR) repeat protein/V8-like Glu-specific endopeptidase
MHRRTNARVAALALLPLGQPLLLGTLGITTATTAVVLHQGVAVAQDSSAVARIAKAITVRIEGATQGSGVIVKKEGNSYTVLTAWHVVSGNRPGEGVGIYTPDRKQHQLEQGSIQRLGQVDMAVLTFSSPGAYEVASVGDVKKVKYDDPIYVAGFPVNNSQNLSYEQGEVVANAEVGIDQGYQLLYDNKTFPGMSGGVLLNVDGELIGLHGRGEKVEQSSNGEIVMKTGVNQGVPITYYNQFISGSPVVVSKTTATTSDDYLAQAKASLGEKGREQTVIRLANQALSIRPSADGYFFSAYSKSGLKDYQRAIADYSKAIELEPQAANVYYNRALIKSKTKDYQGSIIDLSKTISIDPQDDGAYYNRGLNKHILKDYQGAIVDYSNAITINPQDDDAYNNRGLAKIKSKDDYKGAIADYNKAIAINPQSAAAYANRGSAKRQSKDYQGAIADYNKAIAINPQETAGYYNRGNTKRELNDYQGAIADYNKAIAINPQHASAYYNRGLVKDKSKDYQGAIADYNKAIAINPQHAPFYAARGDAKHKLKDYQGAIADYSKSIAINPQYAFAYSKRGLTKVAFKDYQGACADLGKAASLGHQKLAQYLNSEEGARLCNVR